MTDVSVGLPVFNGEKLVNQAIDSILSQTYGDFELIISDNASSDATEDICREYASSDPRVKYFRNDTNIGAAANFRRVVELASSKYFKWLGVDDYVADSYLEKTRKVLEERSDVVLCCSKVDIVDENSEIIRHYDDPQAVISDSPKDRFTQYINQDSWINAVYGLMRRESLVGTSVMGSFTGSDVVVMAEMTLHGKFFEIPETLFYRRYHPDAYSFDCDDDKQQDFYNPGNKQRSLVLYRCRHLLEHWRSIRRAPIDSSDKRALMWYLLRSVGWHRQEIVREIKTYVFG